MLATATKAAVQVKTQEAAKAKKKLLVTGQQLKGAALTTPWSERVRVSACVSGCASGSVRVFESVHASLAAAVRARRTLKEGRLQNSVKLDFYPSMQRGCQGPAVHSEPLLWLMLLLLRLEQGTQTREAEACQLAVANQNAHCLLSRRLLS